MVKDLAQSGMHVHFSLWKDGKNILGEKGTEYGLSADGEHFFAGIREHIRAIMAFSSPTHLGCLRAAAPPYNDDDTWGIDSRLSNFRVVSPPASQAVTHFEVKVIDNCCNAYYAIAAMIVSGIEGLKHKSKLPPPVSDWHPEGLSTAQKVHHKVRKLPTSFKDMVDILKTDEGKHLMEFFGSEVMDTYIKAGLFEEENFSKMSIDEEVQFLKQKY